MTVKVNGRRRTARVVGALAALATVALAGCGADNTSGSEQTPVGADSPAPALSGTPITIGYAASMSGAQASNGLSGKAVAHAFQEYTNAHGGILGHPVEVTVTDTKNTVPGATSVVKGFMGDSDVDAVILTDLVAESAMTDTLKNTDVAVISGNGATNVPWSTVPGLFQDVSGAEYAARVFADVAKAAGTEKLGWAVCSEVANCQENSDKGSAYAETLGVAPVGTQLISASASDYTAPCLSFAGKGTDGIAMYAGYTTGTRFATDCLRQGYSGTFLTANSGFDQSAFGKVSGFKSYGSTEGFPWWADDPAVATYRDAMAKYSPDGAWQSGNATAIWSSFELFRKALDDAKPATIDRGTVMDAMYQVKDETLGGLLAQPVTYTKGEPSRPVECSWFLKFDAGDDEPTSIAPAKSGNGATGDLASTCGDNVGS
ncbi:ABC transporter substrate-binding protein [Rhodococcus koreensis]|uniref:ABC transporter substrate-binding protein n=1 Tax=Rhodococcus koreensis TaxID=99653 RepID=UPI003671C626